MQTALSPKYKEWRTDIFQLHRGEKTGVNINRHRRFVNKMPADLQRFPNLSIRKPDMNVTTTLLMRPGNHVKHSYEAGSAHVRELTPMNGQQKADCTSGGSSPCPGHSRPPLHWYRSGSEERPKQVKSSISTDQYCLEATVYSYPLEVILQHAGHVVAEVATKRLQTVKEQHHKAIIGCKGKENEEQIIYFIQTHLFFKNRITILLHHGNLLHYIINHLNAIQEENIKNKACVYICIDSQY